MSELEMSRVQVRRYALALELMQKRIDKAVGLCQQVIAESDRHEDMAIAIQEALETPT